MTPEELQQVTAIRELAAAGRLRELREQRRLSLRDIAGAIGVTASTVLRWEQRTRVPSSRAALRLALIFAEQEVKQAA